MQYVCEFKEQPIIEFDDQIAVTGGWNTRPRVDVYNMDGWYRELPRLNTGRYQHGCGQYINAYDKMVNYR